MKPYQGSCQNILLLEKLIVNRNPNCILLDKKIVGAKLFEVQKDFDSQVIVRQYTYIIKDGFLPKEHPLSFHYNFSTDHADVYTTRKLADMLVGNQPEFRSMMVQNGNGNGNKK